MPAASSQPPAASLQPPLSSKLLQQPAAGHRARKGVKAGEASPLPNKGFPKLPNLPATSTWLTHGKDSVLAPRASLSQDTESSRKAPAPKSGLELEQAFPRAARSIRLSPTSPPPTLGPAVLPLPSRPSSSTNLCKLQTGPQRPVARLLAPCRPSKPAQQACQQPPQSSHGACPPTPLRSSCLHLGPSDQGLRPGLLWQPCQLTRSHAGSPAPTSHSAGAIAPKG